MKKLFYRWGFLDLGNSSRIKDTYFYINADEVAQKNLKMISSLSVFFAIVCIAVIIMSLTFFGSRVLAIVYSIVFVIEAVCFLLTKHLQKAKKNIAPANILSSLYLMHLLIIGAVVGTVYSPNETAVIYVVVLAISQLLFILPPLLTTFISATTTLITLIMSCNIKPEIYYNSDIINCLGVFILSVLLGWHITKIRVEESSARNKAMELNQELMSMSYTDQLTTLQNHRSFQDIYYNLFNELKSTGDAVGIIMMDIDKFKLYNDNYGHIEGDICLNGIGICFETMKSENVIPFRFGGEEFVVLVKSTECRRIAEIAEQFREAVEELSIPHKYSPAADVVTVSVGYHIGYPRRVSMPTELVDCADQALYLSKKSGGNTVTGI